MLYSNAVGQRGQSQMDYRRGVYNQDATVANFYYGPLNMCNKVVAPISGTGP